MQHIDDPELLRRYAEDSSEAAFAELVRRHLNLVYASALRRVGGDAHLAQDVTQQVFTAMARSASALAQRTVLAGWLYTTTRYAAAHVVRGERRRHEREQEAYSMNELTSDPLSTADWERLRPLLDGALDSLGERDREAVLLRFFEGRSFGAIASTLRLSEDAARRRVERALRTLETALARKGVRSTATALGLILASHAGSVAAPASVAASVTGAALAGAATVGASASAGAGILAILTSGKVIAGTTLAVGMLASGAVVTERQSPDAEVALASAGYRSPTLPMQATITPVAAGAAQSEAERLAQERAYQQKLVKRRAEEAIARAKAENGVPDTDPAREFHRLIQLAEEQLAKAEFQRGLKTYNRAMTLKPAAEPMTERLKQLQAALEAQNIFMDVVLRSDGQTWVAVWNVHAPKKFLEDTIRIQPGDYEVVGRRKGYRDEVRMLRVRAGQPVPEISIVCTVKAGP
jgi:RNA polymerase sigma factor (sigma-70 family)